MKQGWVLAPGLFNLFFTCVLNHKLHDSTSGVYLQYRPDSSLFNLRWLNARTRTLERLIMEALFTDDYALIAHLQHELQTIVGRFAKDSCLFGLTVSLIKTKVKHQPTPESTANSSLHNIDVTQLKSVHYFKYLGSVFSSDGTLIKENRGLNQKGQSIVWLPIPPCND